MTRVRAASLALVVSLLCGVLAGGCGPSKPPCAAPIVAQYIAEMVAAGCTGDHFNDERCAVIKAKRDAREQEAGCKP